MLLGIMIGNDLFYVLCFMIENSLYVLYSQCEFEFSGNDSDLPDTLRCLFNHEKSTPAGVNIDMC